MPKAIRDKYNGKQACCVANITAAACALPEQNGIIRTRLGLYTFSIVEKHHNLKIRKFKSISLWKKQGKLFTDVTTY